MAYKSFSKLSSRNQSSLVSQLNQLISYYGEIFCPRERVYLKNLSKTEGTIYWLENEDKKLVAAAIVDKNYTFTANGVTLTTLGHTISKRPGQMDRILTHIFSDYQDNSLVLLCRPGIAEGIQTQIFDLVPMTALELTTYWPELAHIQTDYFNTSKETLAQGMDRKQHYIYIKLSSSDWITLKREKPELIEFIEAKLAEIQAKE